MNLRRVASLLLIPLLAAAVVGACTSSADDPPQRLRGGAWRALPESPLEPRHSSGSYWVGGRVVIIGGTTAPPCPPNADCVAPTVPPRRDGAAFDPVSKTWRKISDAPVPIESPVGAVLGNDIYLLVPRIAQAADVREAFLAYHADSDRWEELSMPPGPRDGLRLVASASGIVAYHGSQELGERSDHVYDPTSRKWSALPRDPLAPSFDRSVVWTGERLVVLGLQVVPNPGSERPSLYRAATLDAGSSQWIRLPDSQIAGYNPEWFWSGGMIVNPWVGGSDGGSDWDRPYPYGGMLDPNGPRWLPLWSAPAAGSYDGPLVAGPRFVTTRGRVLDVSAGEWLRLTQPPSDPDAGAAVVWAGDQMVLWGGYRFATGTAQLLDEGWIWEPIAGN